ncbi:MAG: hypothetical protein ACYTGQ_14845, partial [Planctomycetota bacterium]
MGAFPLADLSGGTEIDENTPFSKDIVDESIGKAGTMYTAIITDIASFADNPDLALAEARRDEMTLYASDLADKFQLFAEDLQLELDSITDAPLAPAGLTATAAAGNIALDWADNVETDLAFYNLYRSTTSGGPSSLYAAGITDSQLIDAGVSTGTTYFYVVT